MLIKLLKRAILFTMKEGFLENLLNPLQLSKGAVVRPTL